MPTKKDIQKWAKAARTIAFDAGDLLMDFYKKAETNPKVLNKIIKADGTPCLQADLDSDALIVSRLQALTPHIPVISEETSNHTDSKIYWIVDPLDGTKEFINRTGGFSVKIALIENGQPIIGIINAPAQNTLYHSIEGGKAYKLSGRDKRSRQIRTAKANPQSLRSLFNALHCDINNYARYQKIFADAQLLALPASPDPKAGLPRNMQIAEGLADTQIKVEKVGDEQSLSNTFTECAGYVWDEAADRLIVENAGGAIISLHTGKPPEYHDPESRTEPYITLGDAKLAPAIAQFLKSRAP